MSSPVIIDSMETMRRIVDAVRYVERLRQTTAPSSPATPAPPMSLVTAQVIVTGSTPSAYGFYPGVIQRLNTEVNTGWYNELPSPLEVRVREIDGQKLTAGDRYTGVVVGDLSDSFGEDEGFTALVVDYDFAPGCNIKQNPDDGTYYVDPNVFSGYCLVVDNSNPVCPIVGVDPVCLTTGGTFVIGCGLTAVAGVVLVDRVALVGPASLTSLVVGPGDCDLAVDLEPDSTTTEWVVEDSDYNLIMSGGELCLLKTKTRVEYTNVFNAAGLLTTRFESDRTSTTIDGGCIDPCTITQCCDADPLEVTSSGVPTSGSAPLDVDFDSTVTGGVLPYTYDWNFDDGSDHGTTSNPSHTFDDAGTYNVVLTVTDACGSATAATTVVVTAGGGGSGCSETWYEALPTTLEFIVTGASDDCLLGLHGDLDLNTGVSPVRFETPASPTGAVCYDCPQNYHLFCDPSTNLLSFHNAGSSCGTCPPGGGPFTVPADSVTGSTPSWTAVFTMPACVFLTTAGPDDTVTITVTG